MPRFILRNFGRLTSRIGPFLDSQPFVLTICPGPIVYPNAALRVPSNFEKKYASRTTLLFQLTGAVP